MFDGDDDYIEVTSSSNLEFDLNTDLSLSVWVQQDDDISGDQHLLDKRVGSGAGRGYDFLMREGLVSFALQGGSGLHYESDLGIIGDTVWHNIVAVITRSPAKVHIFIDGVENTPGTFSNYDFSNSGSLIIGGRFTKTALFSGVLDDIRIYNRVLTESEIQELYNEGGCNCPECPNDGYNEGYKEGYEAGLDDCVNIEKPPFSGELPDAIQTYLILTDNSAPFTLSPGSYIQSYGSNGSNIVNIGKYAQVEFQNFIGANEVNIEEISSEFTVYRSGATVYLKSILGTLIEIAATATSQTIRFADGSSELIISDGNVMLGSQILSATESGVNSPVNGSDISAGMF